MQRIMQAVPIYIQLQTELRDHGVTHAAFDLLFQIERISHVADPKGVSICDLVMEPRNSPA